MVPGGEGREATLGLWLEFGQNELLAVIRQREMDAMGIGRQDPIHSLEHGATRIVLSYALVTLRRLYSRHLTADTLFEILVYFASVVSCVEIRGVVVPVR